MAKAEEETAPTEQTVPETTPQETVKPADMIKLEESMNQPSEKEDPKYSFSDMKL